MRCTAQALGEVILAVTPLRLSLRGSLGFSSPPLTERPAPERQSGTFGFCPSSPGKPVPAILRSKPGLCRPRKPALPLTPLQQELGSLPFLGVSGGRRVTDQLKAWKWF